MTQEKEVLRMALEFIERVNKDGWILADFEPQMYAVMTAINEALAQPEEPCDMKEMCIGCSPRNADGSCPDAPRKPLSDDEIKRIWGSYFSRGLEFARAIEAAHGIKEDA